MKPRRVFLLVIGVIFFLAAAILFNTRSIYKTTTAVISDHLLTLEIADTDELRAQGLSGRKGLAEDNGMLFIFPIAGYYSFWMKGMNFPLDFIWIRNNIVVDLTENVATGDLPTFTSKSPADKVIEVNVGVIKSSGIKIGDWIQFK